MKRFLCGLMVFALLICMVPVSARAMETEVIYLEDGSYITVELHTHGTRASGSVTGSKVYTHYGKNGETNWMVILTGTFTYTGSSATCKDSSVDATIYDSSWYVVSKSASKSGSKATASATMGYKTLGVTVTKVPVDLTLSCDADGNLS